MLDSTVPADTAGTDTTTPAERTYLVQFGDHLPTARSFELISTPDCLAGDIHTALDPGGNWDFEVVLTDTEGGVQLGRVVNDDGSDSGYGTLTITDHTTPTDPAAAIRRRLAAELHRIADDIVRLGLPVGEYPSLRLGVLKDRAALERWASYLSVEIAEDGGTGNNIPKVDCELLLTDNRFGPRLGVHAQTPPDGRSELERLRAEVAELRAQRAGGSR